MTNSYGSGTDLKAHLIYDQLPRKDAFPQPRSSYLSRVLRHVPHNDDDLPLEALERRGVRALGELSFCSEGGAEGDVDAVRNVTPNKTEKMV